MTPSTLVATLRSVLVLEPDSRSDQPASLRPQERIAVAFALIAIFLVLAAAPRIAPPHPLKHLPEVVQAYEFVDSSSQLQALKVAVAVLALGVLGAGWLSRARLTGSGLFVRLNCSRCRRAIYCHVQVY